MYACAPQSHCNEAPRYRLAPRSNCLQRPVRSAQESGEAARIVRTPIECVRILLAYAVDIGEVDVVLLRALRYGDARRERGTIGGDRNDEVRAHEGEGAGRLGVLCVEADEEADLPPAVLEGRRNLIAGSEVETLVSSNVSGAR